MLPSATYCWYALVLALLLMLKSAQITGPRLLHGCIAAVTDIWIALLAKKIAGGRYASTAVSLLYLRAAELSLIDGKARPLIALNLQRSQSVEIAF